MAERICLTPGCERPIGPHGARGLCPSCYSRSRRPVPPTLEERFWAKVDKRGPVPEYRPDLGPCWIWTAWVTEQGYGRFTLPGRRKRPAHRVAWQWLVGPIPDDLPLDHLCRVHSCLKVIEDESGPAHLEPVTNRENILRGHYGALTTHCPAGHPYDGANTYWGRTEFGNPTRACRACGREHKRRVRRGG
jgi:hypothetical protein